MGLREDDCTQGFSGLKLGVKRIFKADGDLYCIICDREDLQSVVLLELILDWML